MVTYPASIEQRVTILLFYFPKKHEMTLENESFQKYSFYQFDTHHSLYQHILLVQMSRLKNSIEPDSMFFNYIRFSQQLLDEISLALPETQQIFLPFQTIFDLFVVKYNNDLIISMYMVLFTKRPGSFWYSCECQFIQHLPFETSSTSF